MIKISADLSMIACCMTVGLDALHIYHHTDFPFFAAPHSNITHSLMSIMFFLLIHFVRAHSKLSYSRRKVLFLAFNMS